MNLEIRFLVMNKGIFLKGKSNLRSQLTFVTSLIISDPEPCLFPLLLSLVQRSGQVSKDQFGEVIQNMQESPR